MFDINPPSAEALELLGVLQVAFWVLMVAAAISAGFLTIYFVGCFYERSTQWWQCWPFRIVCFFDVICAVAIVAILAIPALAATTIPVYGTNVVIDVGDIPPWIAAFVLFATFWEARKARRHAAEAALAIKEVKHQTDGMLETMKQSAEEKGKQKHITELAAAKEAVRTDAVADARVDAEVQEAKNSKHVAATFTPVERSLIEAQRLNPQQEKQRMSKYQNKPVTKVRDARQGDQGFDAAKDQVVIRLEDNSEKTVLRTEVSES